MNTKLARQFARLFLVVLFFGISALLAPMVTPRAQAAPAVPVESLLNADGTLNTSKGIGGAIDLKGWNVTLDAKRGPILTPQTAPPASPSAIGWSALANNGLNGTNVTAIAVSGTDVYVGGVFTASSDGTVTNLNRIAKYSGGAWSALANNGLNGTVNAFAVSGTDLYVGGNFTGSFDNAVNMNLIARYGNVTLSCTSQNSGNWNTAATWNCGSVPSTGDVVTIANTHTVTLDVDTADLGSFTLNSGGTLTNNGAAHTLKLTGNWSRSGTFTPGTFVGVTFDGTGAQTVTGATTFYNLTFNNTGSGVTVANNLTVNGALTQSGAVTLNANINMGANVATLNSGATLSGAGDIIGKVRRTSPATGVALQFNNQYTTLTFTTAPTQMDVTLVKSAPSGWANPVVSRYYTLEPTGSVDATVQLAYQTSELNGNTEANLKLWRYNGSQWQYKGGTANTTNHFVSLSGVTQFSDWALSSSAPTAATLTGFNATLTAKGAVRVSWQTGTELDLVGFNVWRKTGKGEWVKLNANLIAAKHMGEITGDTYSRLDKKVKPGKTYLYKLELLRAGGSSEWSEVKRVAFK